MRVRTYVALGGALLAAFAAASFQGVKLAWTPKAGAVTKHKIVVTPEIPGMEMTITMNVASKILKVDGDKVTVEDTVTSSSMMMNGQEMDPPEEMGGNERQVSVYSLNHELITPPDKQQFPRMEESISLVFPPSSVNPGDTWTRTGKANPQRGTVDSQTRYTYDGTEKVGKWDCYKVKFTYKEKGVERPMVNSGTFWIAVSDGELVKSEMQTMDFEFQPGMYGNSKTISTRIE